jgi:hypothetical protein
MKLFSNRRISPKLETKAQAMALVPAKNSQIQETQLPNNEILIHYKAIPPKTIFSFLLGRRHPMAGETHLKKIQLDALGSEVWRLIDNDRSVQDIVDHFAEAHRLSSREAEVAVTHFFRSLGRRGLIGLR